jgi:hypothetical protein
MQGSKLSTARFRPLTTREGAECLKASNSGPCCKKASAGAARVALVIGAAVRLRLGRGRRTCAGICCDDFDIDLHSDSPSLDGSIS